MGEHYVEENINGRRERAFVRALLDDLAALVLMLDGGRVESGLRRVGAEQEMFLVDRHMRPAPVAVEVISRAGDPRLTTEIARFNLEANLSPRLLEGDCFRRMHREAEEVVSVARAAASGCGADVLLAGILPTLRRGDLELDSITPMPRYRKLNDSVMRMRGGPFNVHIKGLDEVNVTAHDFLAASARPFEERLRAGHDSDRTL